MSVKEELSRQALMFGEESTKKLSDKRILIFGVGGVGGFLCEAVARAGIGHIDIVDKDIVCASDMNRQITALHSSLGKDKVEVMKQRILDINPDCVVGAYKKFYLPENADEFDFSKYDYIADATDNVTAKTEIACRAYAARVPVISAMGAGNKTDPCGFEVADIYSTEVCPLSKIMRRELKRRGVLSLRVVYSKEIPVKTYEKTAAGKNIVGSLSFVPSVMGLIMAGEIIKDLIK